MSRLDDLIRQSEDAEEQDRCICGCLLLHREIKLTSHLFKEVPYCTNPECPNFWEDKQDGSKIQKETDSN